MTVLNPCNGCEWYWTYDLFDTHRILSCEVACCTEGYHYAVLCGVSFHFAILSPKFLGPCKGFPNPVPGLDGACAKNLLVVSYPYFGLFPVYGTTRAWSGQFARDGCSKYGGTARVAIVQSPDKTVHKMC